MARKPRLGTADQLIQVALALFADHSYAATTIQDIAKKAKVNVSLVSYHFNGKEGLFRACFERAASHRLEAAKGILLEPKSVDEFKVRLDMFTDEMLVYHLENSSICKIMHRDLIDEMKIVGDIFERTLLQAFKTFVTFIDQAKSKGFLASWVDPLTTAGMYYSALINMAKNDDIAKQYFNRTLNDSTQRATMRQYIIQATLEGIRP
jgi:AcrR family transcriptional regulator